MLGPYQSCSQSLRSPWPAVGKRELWEQPFWNNKGNNRILPIWFNCAVCIYGACLKWLLPELWFSDRWSRGTKTLGTRLRPYSCWFPQWTLVYRHGFIHGNLLHSCFHDQLPLLRHGQWKRRIQRELLNRTSQAFLPWGRQQNFSNPDKFSIKTRQI